MKYVEEPDEIRGVQKAWSHNDPFSEVDLTKGHSQHARLEGKRKKSTMDSTVKL